MVNRYVLIGILLAIICINIYSYRSVYLTPYDSIYWQELYDNSQWRIPNSKRSIGDELLYQVAGHYIIRNGKIFEINPEVPPLGKYIYGFSIYLINNAYVAALIMFIITLFLYKKLGEKFLSADITGQYIALILFSSDLLILSQAGQTMLDLPQLMLLLLHILFFYKSQEKEKDNYFILLAGITLGLFAAVKIGYTTIIILVANCLYLAKNKKIFNIPLLLLSTCIGYLSVYIPFFLQGKTILEFIKSELWVLNFYLSSKAIVSSTYGMAVISLITGFIRGWGNEADWARVKEWSIFWPFYLFSLFLFTFLYLKSKKIRQEYPKIDYLLILTIFLLISLMIIPFFARYLVIIIPFAIIFFIVSIRKIKTPPFVFYVFVILISTIHTLQYLNFIFPSPYEFLSGVETIWRNSAYRDIYNGLDTTTKQKINRDQFEKIMINGEKKYFSTKDRYVVIEKKSTKPWQNTTTVRILLIDSENKRNKLQSELKLKRELNRWKIDWFSSAISNHYK